MYYSVLIEAPDETGQTRKMRTHTLLDQPNMDNIMKEIVAPYLGDQDFWINGYIVNKSTIKRLKIVSSEETIKSITAYREQTSDLSMYLSYTEATVISSDQDESIQDITGKVFSEYKKGRKKTQDNNTLMNNKVFIVHGHDDAMKYAVSNFLRKVGLEPIILHEQVNQGKTIIEKIEEWSAVGYGIVLYSPCDKGGTAETSLKNMKYRARQNVVFEHGYLIAKLGRNKVCALVDGDIETPSDINGVVYIPYQAGLWELAVGKELKSAGYDINLNDL